MNKVVQYIFINKSLHMTVGKVASQAVHGSIVGVVNSTPEMRNRWEDSKERYVIVLEARDEQHMINIQKYLDSHGISTHIIIDEGANEIDPHTVTALATELLVRNTLVLEGFEGFKTYRDVVKVSLEYEK